MISSVTVVSYLNVLVWPVTLIISLVLFRDPIRNLLGSIEEFEGFGIRARISRQVGDASSRAQKALNESRIHGLSVTELRPIRIRLPLALAMADALRLSSGIASRRAPGQASGQRRDMRAAVERLDIAVNSVIIVVATSPSMEWQADDWAELNPVSIELRLSQATSVTGWKGVIEARDILKDTLAATCGSSVKTLNPSDVAFFLEVGMAALERWQALVAIVVDSARRNAERG